MGWIYEGEWQNGWKHGYGRMISKDNSYYIGQFVGGWRQGRGLFCEPGKASVDGMWFKGEFVGNAPVEDTPDKDRCTEETTEDDTDRDV
jgi:hypothetical protein